jgi:homocitrate synthase
MCPTPLPATNGTNGHTNGTNGNSSYVGIDITEGPPVQNGRERNPYAPVQDFLSNISKFKVIESTLREGEQ